MIAAILFLAFIGVSFLLACKAVIQTAYFKDGHGDKPASD